MNKLNHKTLVYLVGLHIQLSEGLIYMQTVTVHCVFILSLTPALNSPSASYVPYETDLGDKHWPTDTTGLWTENKNILLNHYNFRSYVLLTFPR